MRLSEAGLAATWVRAPAGDGMRRRVMDERVSFAGSITAR